MVIPIFGINFLMSFKEISFFFFLNSYSIFNNNIISFNSYKSEINTCNNCGAVSLGLSETCMNCSAI